MSTQLIIKDATCPTCNRKLLVLPLDPEEVFWPEEPSGVVYKCPQHGIVTNPTEPPEVKRAI